MAKIIYLIAGEPSGDILGARLIEALKQHSTEPLQFLGVGGPQMEKAGLTSLFPMHELAHFGLFELLPQIPNILRRIRQTILSIKKAQPAVLITIDSPDFCFRIVKKLKGTAIPLIHYVAPSVWAWRPERAQKIAQLYHHLFCLLPFEPNYFTVHNLPSTFVGHAALEGRAVNNDDAALPISTATNSIVVLPGSRMAEITRLLPVFGEAIKQLAASDNIEVLLPTLPHLHNVVKQQTAAWPCKVSILLGEAEKFAAFKHAKLALAASGTVSVELALTKTPMIIAYKISPLTYILYKRLIKIPYVSLINIMAGRMVVPEFLQNDCRAPQLAHAMRGLLHEQAKRDEQLQAFADFAQWLSPNGQKPSDVAAKKVMEISGIACK